MRKSEREVKDWQVIDNIISKSDVCRLALVDNGQPYIVAMNFGFIKGNPDCLYFHCALEGRKMDILKKNNKVCFQMDIDHELIKAKKACGYTMNFKSIIGYGTITTVDNKNEKVLGLNTIMSHYSDRDDFIYEDKMLSITTILRLDIESMSAKMKV